MIKKDTTYLSAIADQGRETPRPSRRRAPRCRCEGERDGETPVDIDAEDSAMRRLSTVARICPPIRVRSKVSEMPNMIESRSRSEDAVGAVVQKAEIELAVKAGGDRESGLPDSIADGDSGDEDKISPIVNRT